MYLFGKKELNVYEYDSNSILQKNIRSKIINQHPIFKFTFTRLSIALAKTILTYEPNLINLIFETSISSLQIFNSISVRSNNIKVKSGFRNVYRDFSLNTKIGEMAQAISVLFAQDILGYPIILDFYGYLIVNQFKYPGNNKKKPDFVLCLKSRNAYSFLESKGICQKTKVKSLKNKLQEALNQCKTAENKLKNIYNNFSLTNIYGVVTELSEYGNNWDSSLYFADPSSSSIITEEGNQSRLIRYYYAAWFAFLGYYEIVNNLTLNRTLQSLKPIEKRIINNNAYILFGNDRDMFNRFHSLHQFNTFFPYFSLSYGISEKVWEILNDDNDIRMVDNYLKLNILPESNKDYELFRDGTIAFYNVSNK